MLRTAGRVLVSALAVLLAAVVPAGAQDTKLVGVLFGTTEDDPSAPLFRAAVAEGLALRGWTVGVDVRLEIRWSRADRARAAALGAELIAMNPDAILVGTTPVAEELHKLTTTIPLVFSNVSDPVASGLVDGLATPGGNVTGFTNLSPTLPEKWVEYLRAVAPDTGRLYMLYNPVTAPGAGDFYWTYFQSAVVSVGGEAIRMPVADLDAARTAIAALAGEDGAALAVSADVFTYTNRAGLIEAATAAGIPTIYPFTPFVDGGGLMAYGIDPVDPYRSAGEYVGRILSGADPATLPVQQPTRFTLSINLTAAAALGISIPVQLLALADAIVQ